MTSWRLHPAEPEGQTEKGAMHSEGNSGEARPDPLTRELLLTRDRSVNEAVQLIWERFSRWLGSMATRKTAGDGDDLVQEVMASVLQQLPEYDGEPPIYEWLRRMLRDRARNDRSRDTRQQSLRETQALSVRESLFKARFPSPEARTEARQKLARLNVAIAALPELDREIFERRFSLNEHPEIIGDAIGMKSAAVSVRITRIRARLSDAIRRQESPRLTVL